MSRSSTATKATGGDIPKDRGHLVAVFHETPPRLLPEAADVLEAPDVLETSPEAPDVPDDLLQLICEGFARRAASSWKSTHT